MSYFEDSSVERHDFRPLNSGRGGRRVGAGRKPLPAELKRERRAMRKQITISWNMCHDWENKKAQAGIKRDREFLQYLLQQNHNRPHDNPRDDDNPLGSMANYVAYINDLRLEEKLCDVTFVIKESETSYVHAHKLVLMMTSRYFQTLTREELASRNEFYLQDVTMKGIQLLLDFMYGRVIDPVEHYKNLQQTTQTASLLQVDVYLQNVRSIARRGRKMMETDEMTSQTSEAVTGERRPYYVMMANGQPGLMVPFSHRDVDPGNDDVTTASSSDLEIRESSADLDDGSLVSEKSANVAAAALDEAYINPRSRNLDSLPCGDLSSRNFDCLLCRKSFKRHVLLQRHTRLMHTYRYTTWLYRRRKILAYLRPVEKAENNCKFCKSSFANLIDLRRHKSTVHRYIRVPKSRRSSDGTSTSSNRPLQCSFCPDMFDSKRLLKEHILIKHRQKSERLQCSKCQRTFSLKESLENHMKYRHNVIMNNQIVTSSSQENIVKVEKKTNQVESSRVFDSIAALRQMAKPPQSPTLRHQVAAQSKPQLRCHLCSLTYNHKSLLMKHIQIVHQDQEKAPPPAVRTNDPPPRSFDPPPRNLDPPPRAFDRPPRTIDHTPRNVDHPPPPPLMRAPITDSEKQAWRCHICELPFGFHWSLIRHLELVHRIVGTHLDVTRTSNELQEQNEECHYQQKHDYRRSKSKTVRQLIEQSQDRQPRPQIQDRQFRPDRPDRPDDGPTIKEILERKIRRREDRSLQQLEDRFGSTSMVPNTRYGDMLQFDSVPTYPRRSPPTEYAGIASPQQLTAMVQAPLLPFSTSPQSGKETTSLEHEYDNDGFSMPQTPEDRNARRRHRLTGQNEPVPQPPREHDRILATRVNIQRPAYSQMTFKLVKSKKDPKGESELKLWPQHREIYDCSGCGQAFSRYPSYAKHVVKCVGELPELPQSVTGTMETGVDKRRGPKPKPSPVRHYDFKEYCPPDNKFRYQYSV